jgi:leucyl/phenylalanyl-tRNA---protein transferase
MPVFWLDPNRLVFPNPELANPDGIVAIGGDLSPRRLLLAYRRGLFPWFNDGEPILWWSLDPRLVLLPTELKVAKSMRPYFNQGKFRVSYDHAFEAVMRGCQNAERKNQVGSWISEQVIQAYTRLHTLGYAHSVEVWDGDLLVGGLYGIALGKVFFGESMFAEATNASKFGFISLVRRLEALNFWLIDCQQQTQHLVSLGATPIPRTDFLKILKKNEAEPHPVGNWQNW